MNEMQRKYSKKVRELRVNAYRKAEAEFDIWIRRIERIKAEMLEEVLVGTNHNEIQDLIVNAVIKLNKLFKEGYNPDHVWIDICSEMERDGIVFWNFDD